MLYIYELMKKYVIIDLPDIIVTPRNYGEKYELSFNNKKVADYRLLCIVKGNKIKEINEIFKASKGDVKQFLKMLEKQINEVVINV